MFSLETSRLLRKVLFPVVEKPPSPPKGSSPTPLSHSLLMFFHVPSRSAFPELCPFLPWQGNGDTVWGKKHHGTLDTWQAKVLRLTSFVPPMCSVIYAHPTSCTLYVLIPSQVWPSSLEAVSPAVLFSESSGITLPSTRISPKVQKRQGSGAIPTDPHCHDSRGHQPYTCTLPPQTFLAV